MEYNNNPISHETNTISAVIGYLLFIGTILYVMYFFGSHTFWLFIDYSSISIVVGGTMGIVVMSGGMFKPPVSTQAKRICWQTITTALAGASLAGMGIGLIMLLNTLDDPGQFGPAMGVVILSPLTALLGLTLISLPKEDHYNKRVKVYREFSISRMVWFGFPLLTTFFVYLTLFILVNSIVQK